MLEIKQTWQFSADYRRELGVHRRPTLGIKLVKVLKVLINNQPLAEKYGSQALVGDLKDRRGCYVSPNLVLIYHKSNEEGDNSLSSFMEKHRTVFWPLSQGTRSPSNGNFRVVVSQFRNRMHGLMAPCNANANTPTAKMISLTSAAEVSAWIGV